MRNTIKLLPIMLLILGGCKEPPDIDDCLLKIQMKEIVLMDGSNLNIIDLDHSFASCTPVNPVRKQYHLSIAQLDKYYAESNPDHGVLKKWIVDNSK